MSTTLRSTQATRSKDLEGTKRKGISPTTSHMIDWQDHRDYRVWGCEGVPI